MRPPEAIANAFHLIKPLPRAFVTDGFELAIPASKLTPISTGFLYSYTRLIVSDLDLSLALKYGLVDDCFSKAGAFDDWKRFIYPQLPWRCRTDDTEG